VPLDADVNFRGVGEGGMIVAPPTVVNAIEDALGPFGVRIYEQHLPPARILELIAAANAGLPRHAEAKEINEEPSGFQDGAQRLERFALRMPSPRLQRLAATAQGVPAAGSPDSPLNSSV
jgi:hypothetical protein